MKKTLASILCFMCVTLAPNAAGIGYINHDVLSKNYSLAKKYTNNLNNKVNSIKTYTAQKDKEMNNAKTQAQKAAIKKTAVAEIEKRQKDYLLTRQKYEADLTKKINAAAETVRVQKKLDAVLNKDSVAAGGVDVTQAVLSILK